MKKFLKILGCLIASIIVIIYLGFLFVLPNVIDINKYKPLVQNLAKKYAQLYVDFDSAKISTTPALTAGIKIKNISVKLPDKSEILKTDKLTARVSLPHLLFYTVRVSCLDIENPFVNAEIINNENFKISKHIEKLLTEQNQVKLDEENADLKETLDSQNTQNEQTSQFNIDPSKIKIVVPNAKLNNYKILVNDLKTKHTLSLAGDRLSLGYFNGDSAKIKTNANLYSDENKNISLNVDLNSFIPSFGTKLDEEDDPAKKVELPFINPVTMYRNYDLKANVDSKLKIRKNKEEDITAYGKFNVDDLTLKLGNHQLPESYFHIKADKQYVDLDTNLNITKDENLSLLGKVKYGKSKLVDLKLKSTQIYFKDLLTLSKALLDSLHIRNELSNVHVSGYMIGDCDFKSDFSTVKSNGFFAIMNGGLTVKNIGNVISNAKILILLDNNSVIFKKAGLNIDKSRLDINGYINDDSMVNISAKGNKINLPILYKTFAPKSIKNNYNLTSAYLDLDLSLKGYLEEVRTILLASLSNLNLKDTTNSIAVKNTKLVTLFFIENGSFISKIHNTNLVATLKQTGSTIVSPIFDMDISDKNIKINENEILFNKNSKIKYSGLVENYLKLHNIDFNVNGYVSTADIVKLIGTEYSKYFNYKGSVPLSLTLKGDKNKQVLNASLKASSGAFITPINFYDLAGANTILKTTIDFKKNRLKIKDTGLYDASNNEIFGINGTIVKNKINILRVGFNRAMNCNLHIFPKSSFTIDGKAILYDRIDYPTLSGGFNLTNISIPELLLTLKSLNIDLLPHSAKLSLNDLLLNGSDFNISGILDLKSLMPIELKDVSIKSKLLDVDKLLKVVDNMNNYLPDTTASKSSTTSSDTANIPVIIHNGKLFLKHIKTGNINLTNTIGRFILKDNTLYLRRVRTNVFDGTVKGRIEVDLITMLIKVMVTGENINVEKALLDAANMKDALSGEADFTADISIKGNSYEEQMKNLKGSVDFTVTDGQFGPFGKLENLIIAENIRESEFFQTMLGGIINGLTTIDTSHFALLTGHLDFADGICHVDPITSIGNIISLHLFGDYDLLKNTLDMKARARMTSVVSKVLGPLNAINPVNIASSAAGMNVFAAKAFSIFCEVVPEDEMDILPSFANQYIDKTATKFQITLKGDIAHPFRLVKSFKWLATQQQVDSATEYVNSLPEPTEDGSVTSEVEKQTQTDIKPTFTDKIKAFFKKFKKSKTDDTSIDMSVE